MIDASADRFQQRAATEGELAVSTSVLDVVGRHAERVSWKCAPSERARHMTKTSSLRKWADEKEGMWSVGGQGGARLSCSVVVG